MKKIQTKLATIMFVATILAIGCTKEDTTHQPTEKVAVVMRGEMAKMVNDTRAVINPQSNGLPPQQLDVNIITVNYTTTQPNKIGGQPQIEDWSGQTADNTRGFFGENTDYTAAHEGNPTIKPTDRTDDNKPNKGRIEYTDEAGKAVQKVFYDENGEYYFVRLFHPYNPYDLDDKDNEYKTTEFRTEFTSTTAGKGASIIFHNVDGSQDILCSNLGWGNNDQQIINTAIVEEDDNDPSDDPVAGIRFSHMLSLFNISIKPGSAVVVGEGSESSARYGLITNVRVMWQPGTLIADAMRGMIEPLNDPLTTNYEANDFPDEFPDDPDKNGFLLGTVTEIEGQQVITLDSKEAGYIIVYPGQTSYRIEVQTEKHKWVYGDLKFDTPVEAGKKYNINIAMMEAYEMKIKVEDVSQWWMDHIFN